MLGFLWDAKGAIDFPYLAEDCPLSELANRVLLELDSVSQAGGSAWVSVSQTGGLCLG